MTDSVEWRAVPGYEGLYSVSSTGLVRSERQNKIMSPTFKNHGYRGLRLSKGGVIKDYHVARLVMLAFVGPRPTGAWINHKDGDKLNNCVDNLEYDTPQENHTHAVGLRLHAWGRRHGMVKLTEDQVREIRASSATERELAKQYGVSDSAIHGVRAGKTWKHLAGISSAPNDDSQHLAKHE